MPPIRRLHVLWEFVTLYQDWGRPAELEASGRELQSELLQRLVTVSAAAEANRGAGEPGRVRWEDRYEAGTLKARMARFRDAAADFDEALRACPEAVEPAAYRALLSGHWGDRAAYEETARRLVAQHSASNRGLTLDTVLHVGLLLPGGVDPEDLCGIADRRLARVARDQRLLPRARMLKGLAAYRAGRFAEARKYLSDTRTMEHLPEVLTARFFNAMAMERLGDHSGALALFAAAADEADRLLPRPGVGDLGNGLVINWILCECARREAAALLQGGTTSSPALGRR
jgi:tetratricopeptide (TPR) repeat protein